MKKILAINSFPYGSTGNIMLNILHTAEEALPCQVKAYYGRWKRKYKSNDPICHDFGFVTENLASAMLSRITGMHNIGSIVGTGLLIRKIKKYNPDLIHLHNLHLWNINLPMLFSYLKNSNAKIVWTLHDCWAFTGQCPHFTMAKCDKWKTGCHNCPQYRDYPGTYYDRTKTMWKLKKKWFTGVENMTIVAPSQWLANLVKQSYLQNYPIKVINNGIDLSIFHPTESDFRYKYNIGEKYIVLGVSYGWGMKKGFDVFIELANRLSDQYQVVLVGTDAVTDKNLPSNIISIIRTHNQKELAEIYSAANVFVNPTREENYPTVNMEAIACGTPVVTFNTGGSPEIVNENTGSVVECDDIDGMESEIERICENEPYSMKTCIERAKLFDMHNRFKEYVRLYKTICKSDEKDD